MMVKIEIPVEFVTDFKNGKFGDFFYRVMADMSDYSGMCGLYEMETAYMLLKAFEEGRVLYE